MTDTPTAHVLAQPAWHDDAFLIANRAALVAVRNAIDAALRAGRGRADLFCADGEGYYLTVICREKMADAPLGYTDVVARSGRWPAWVKRGLG